MRLKNWVYLLGALNSGRSFSLHLRVRGESSKLMEVPNSADLRHQGHHDDSIMMSWWWHKESSQWRQWMSMNRILLDFIRFHWMHLDHFRFRFWLMLRGVGWQTRTRRSIPCALLLLQLRRSLKPRGCDWRVFRTDCAKVFQSLSAPFPRRSPPLDAIMVRSSRFFPTILIRLRIECPWASEYKLNSQEIL